MFFEYQLDEDWNRFPFNRTLLCLHGGPAKRKKKIVVLELKVQVKEFKPSWLFNCTCYSFIQFTKKLFKSS